MRARAADVAASKGFARAYGSVFPRSQAFLADPKGRAEGAQTYRARGGVLEEGACPLLHP
jgi:hypothetical protein